jgi:hypothetical protein
MKFFGLISVVLWSLATAGYALPEMVKLHDFGHWRTDISSHGLHSRHFWVDIVVPATRNYERKVGVLWTTNDWQTQQTAYAHHKAYLDGERELWGVDVTVGRYSYFNPPPDDVEIAIFYELEGRTYWDPDNNYSIYNRPTEETPVRLVTANTGISNDGHVWLKGYARALDHGTPGQLYVAYSVDNGANFQFHAAESTGRERWDFKLEGLLGDSPLPENLEFYLVYEDNQGKRLQQGSPEDPIRSYRLAPRLKVQIHDANLNEPLIGLYRVTSQAHTALPVNSYEYQVDDQGWRPLGNGIMMDTRDLNAGTHELQVRVELQGGLLTYSPIQAFEVAHSVGPQDEWILHEGSNHYLSLTDIEQANNSYTILWTDYLNSGQQRIQYIERFNTFRAKDPVWQSPTFEQKLLSLAVDDSQRIWLLAKEGRDFALIRLTPQGEHDQSFGTDGRKTLTNQLDQNNLCGWNHDMKWIAPFLLITDSCNNRILVINDEGTLEQNYPTPSPKEINWTPQRNRLNLLSNQSIRFFTWQPEIRTTLFKLDGEIPLQEIQYPDFIASQSDSYWVLAYDMLYRVAPDGSTDGYWHGGESTGIFGDFDYRPVDLLPAPDGGVFLVQGQGRKKSIIHFHAH